ncbi:MAG: hypothetical protein A3C88_02930 [Candidatus Yanofskybacteria bacterium RIFCSPHIGHO2_02_FULL_50_12]|uniref:histidine kinase n=1 Tax=Candidatus Yanofskybacteria bacterium RIFCSPHIGHO2_02_FULL_50_12 TaxID=1802685 RepID=A0A1F8FTL3_9BACT|nr:MAG: hypothetical protein A3C88_02930 [Candidatus Yanofskybacteria bacterium RIFCSPHIGHO2_02_FULL_50_12]
MAVFLITPLVFSAAPRDGILATYQEAGTLYTIVALLLIAITFFIGGTTMTPIRRILRAQKRFIADASHELRTPLAIMKTNSEVALIDEAHLDPAEAAEALRSNLEEIDRMSKIIENLLSLSFYDNRVAEIPFMPINLSELIAHITEKAKSLAVRKSITLRLLNTDPGMIFGNPVAIEQMAINLIKNAVTYTERGGTVSVSVTLKENNAQLEFKVKDTGIGIQEKDLPHVFSAFYKAGHSRTQHEMESSGLGLTIVKKIVERHHGMIYINSKIGKGTTVSVTFPRITPGSS